MSDGNRVTTVVPTVRGDVAATFRTAVDGADVRVERDAPGPSWHVLLVGVHSSDVDGGPAEDTPDGVLVCLAAGVTSVRIAVPRS